MLDISFLEFLGDLANPQLGFLLRAVIATTCAAIVCAAVGCYVVLRGMALIGDAVAHAVFPGIVIAFSLQVSIVLGGAVAGCIVTILIALFSQRRRSQPDAVIGVFFAASFALGMIIISRLEGYTASLSSFLFGSITGISATDVYLALSAVVLVVAALVLLQPQLTAVCLDRETARAMGIPLLLIDVVLYLCITAAVVISVGTIGNILVIALLITPAATARLLVNTLRNMMLLAVTIGIAGSFFGMYLAWAIDLPAGPTIVLLLTAIFLLTWGISLLPGMQSTHKSIDEKEELVCATS